MPYVTIEEDVWVDLDDFDTDDLVEELRKRKGVNRDEPDTPFDQTPGEKTALAESVHSIALAYIRRFFRQIERLPRLWTRNNAKGGLKAAIE